MGTKKESSLSLPKNRYLLISNLTRTEKEIVVTDGKTWKHFILPPKGSIKIPDNLFSNSLYELQKRKQISITEVIE